MIKEFSLDPDDGDDGNALTGVPLLQTRFCRSPLTVSDMQTDSFSCGRKSPAVVRDEMDGGGETEGREVKEVPDQLETIGMELQQAEGVIAQSTASGT